MGQFEYIHERDDYDYRHVLRVTWVDGTTLLNVGVVVQKCYENMCDCDESDCRNPAVIYETNGQYSTTMTLAELQSYVVRKTHIASWLVNAGENCFVQDRANKRLLRKLCAFCTNFGS